MIRLTKLLVRKSQCATCIYRSDSSLDLVKLEDEVKDERGDFINYRVCHYHTDAVCCRGFWDRYQDEAQVTQIAQKLRLVEFTNKRKVHNAEC